MTTSSSIDSSILLQNLRWRYATKKFDSQKKVSAEIWQALEESLVLTPSSFGLQPWKFIVVTDAELKARLRPHAWNQAQVTDCSHFVIFATKTSMSADYIDSQLELTAKVRGVPVDSMKAYRGMMVGDLVEGARSKIIAEWAARQAYIALGSFMTVCAMMRIDTCPLEGFIPAEFDKILDLPSHGYTASVCCAVGYRSEADKNAKAPKVRFARENVVTTF